MTYKIKPLTWVHNHPPGQMEWWTTFALSGTERPEIGIVEAYARSNGEWRITRSNAVFKNAEDAKKFLEDRHNRLVMLFLEEV